MAQAGAVLSEALRAAPRRYRMPPLPAGADAAAGAPADTALAFAIEAVRTGLERAAPPPDDVRALFTRSLAHLIRAALASDGGDPAFQAMVLRTGDAEVDACVRLLEQSTADRRAARAAVNGLAHPGRLRALPPGPLRDALEQLHQHATGGAWDRVDSGMRLLLREPFLQDDASHEGLRDALHAAVSGESLRRLLRAGEALEHAGVRRWRELRAQHGPAAGSQAAAQQGRASARAGELAERATAQAFEAIAALLNRLEGGAAGYRMVRGLRTPPGFPGDAEKAKDEWDAAIVRAAAEDAPADVVLLAEVKAAPAAATPDFARLLRGLERLALADADAVYTFATADRPLRLHGASLRRLQPRGRALPAHVVYCCSAAAELQPAMLSAASKAVLLAEPASLALAHRLARGEAPPHADLAPVWDALATAPRLRSALHQYATAQAVREAMLHPEDLLSTVARLAA